MDLLYVSPPQHLDPSILTLRQDGKAFHLAVIHTGLTSHKSNRNNANRSFNGHRHNVYHLVLFLSRDNSCLFDGQERHISRGTFVICSPGRQHSFHPQKPGENSYAEITFEYRNSEEVLTIPYKGMLSKIMDVAINLSDGLYTMNETEIHHFMELFHSHFSLLKNVSAGVFDLHMKMAEIFQLTCHLDENKGEIPMAQQIKKRIHSSLPGKLNLEILSREFNRTKATLIKVFRNKYGVTPMEYHRQTRISMTSDLICTSDRTFEDIASLFGFCDVFHFMKDFKKRYGIPPGEFRRKESRIMENKQINL